MEATDLVLRSDLAIFSGYHSEGFAPLLRKRYLTNSPWVFWGERPGALVPSWLGRLYRRVVFPEMHRSRAPVWGIGGLAIAAYRRELGSDRLFLNVPYASNLERYFAIERTMNGRAGCRFMFSGDMSHRKGVDLLAECFVDLIGEGCEAELHLLGQGPLETALRLTTSSVTERVHFHGFKQWEALPTFYANADVLCAPSRRDGWGMIVPEGLAAGMPVISTDKTGAAIELIKTDFGWVVPAGNKVALRDAMRAAANLTEQQRLIMSSRARQSAKGSDLVSGVNRFCDAVDLSLASFRVSSPAAEQ